MSTEVDAAATLVHKAAVKAAAAPKKARKAAAKPEEATVEVVVGDAPAAAEEKKKKKKKKENPEVRRERLRREDKRMMPRALMLRIIKRATVHHRKGKHVWSANAAGLVSLGVESRLFKVLALANDVAEYVGRTKLLGRDVLFASKVLGVELAQ